MTADIPWLAAVNAALLMLGSPGAVLAGQSGSITATGTVPEVISVELPPPQISLPPEIASDGASMLVLLPEPVTLTANIPGRMELSQVQVDLPNGLSQSSVGADISLVANGSSLVVVSTNGSGRVSLPVGVFQANVSGRFYSTTNAPLPAGTYTATTVLSVVAD